MKKKLLSVAMLAAMGAAGSANAVHVNPDGLGQVLIYPYYTVEGGFNTYVNVVNTRNEVKAVKVRFLEGKNSQEVLDFNLYLSPYDVWSGAIVRTAEGAKLVRGVNELSGGSFVYEQSCTAPEIPSSSATNPADGGVDFRNYQYMGDSYNALSRTREGYVEIIEMGVVNNVGIDPLTQWATFATHVNGVPANCAALRTAANVGGPLNNTLGTEVSLPTGGLYGYATLIDVEGGIDTVVDAVALDNFFTHLNLDLDLHTNPGSVNPSLSAVNTVGRMFDGGDLIEFAAAAPGIDDLSAIIAHDVIMNDFMTLPFVGGMTDWVVTFPTKRFYVNPSTTNDTTPATAPFNVLWNSVASRSCEPITISYHDREERGLTAGDDDFSPQPVAVGSSLCNEVNTIAFNAAGTDSVFAAQVENTRYDLSLQYDAGWAAIEFTGVRAATPNGLVGTVNINNAGAAAGGIEGLPVVGFSATSFTNGTLPGGVLSNYVGHSVHKGTRSRY